MAKSCCLDVSVLMLSSTPTEDIEAQAAESGEGVLWSQKDNTGTGGVSLSGQSG
jgi:hypothetical protein